MPLDILAINLLVGAILVLCVICIYYLVLIGKRGVWRRPLVTALLTVAILWAVWSVASLYYRNIYAGGLPSILVSTLGASVQIVGGTVFALILRSIHNDRNRK